MSFVWEKKSFNIAKPPEGALEEVSGWVYGPAGYYVSEFKEQCGCVFRIYRCTHIATGWLMLVATNKRAARAFCEIAASTTGIDEIRTEGGKLTNWPETTGQELRSARTYVTKGSIPLMGEECEPCKEHAPPPSIDSHLGKKGS